MTGQLNWQQIIYILPYSPTAWDAERFGFEYLKKQNIGLRIFDISPLVSTRQDAGSQFLDNDNIIKINSYSQLEHEVKKTAENSVYIDKLNGLSGFKWSTRKVFKIFKKYDVSYYLVEIGTLPLLPNPQTKNIWLKLKKALSIKKLYHYLKWRLGNSIIHLNYQLFACYQLPKKIFVGNTDLLAHYLSRYRLSQADVIPIHSFDYDRYLQYIRNNHAAEATHNTCVFLDQALAYHSDFGKTVSFSPVSPGKYLRSMNQFFDKIENETGLTVVIAASPRANLELTQKMFSGRKVLIGKTLELVAESQLVLMHSSTAVSFAILFNKPIILLKTDEMCRAHGFGNFIENMALSLNLKTTNIDAQEEINQLDFSQYQSIPKNYAAYQYKYIQTKGLPDKTTLEFVLDYLELKRSIK